MSFQFPRCTPEEAGFPSKAVIDFLDFLEHHGIEIHSFMILRHGKVCAEGWWAPYAADITHPVFSFGKSITSTAIGFAEQEGLLSIDEKLVDIFTEYLPGNPSDNLKKVTLRHLLSMSCGHTVEPSAHAEDWIRLFLAHPVDYEPGTMFQYNNTGTNMLVAALNKKTGLSLTEFLRPRLFDPLGMKDVTCAARNGIELGAFGFKLTTDGMARFAQFVLQRGVWNGERLLNEKWFDIATAKQIETVGSVYNGKRDWAAGYCFQYWRFERDDAAFRADGACGQFGIILPKQDAIIITTAGTGLTQQIIDGVWETLVPAMSEGILPENKEELRSLRDKTKNLRIAPLFRKSSRYREERWL
jgi:CubicO group peptidase (beta-lactamase class C family)